MSIKEINRRLREEKEKAVKERRALWHRNHPNGLFAIQFFGYCYIGLYHDKLPHNACVPREDITPTFVVHKCEIKSHSVYDYIGERNTTPFGFNSSPYWTSSYGKTFKFKSLEKFLAGCKKYNIPQEMVDAFLEKLRNE